MNRTACMVLKIVAAGLGLAALVCLLIGSWGNLKENSCVCKRLSRKFRSEYDDYADEELYQDQA